MKHFATSLSQAWVSLGLSALWMFFIPNHPISSLCAPGSYGRTHSRDSVIPRDLPLKLGAPKATDLGTVKMVAEGKKHYPFHLIVQESVEIPKQRGRIPGSMWLTGDSRIQEIQFLPARKGSQAMGLSLLAKDKINKSNHQRASRQATSTRNCKYQNPPPPLSV